MYHDESGVSAIIGTLMHTLITITAASGLTLMVSGMQKDSIPAVLVMLDNAEGLKQISGATKN